MNETKQMLLRMIADEQNAETLQIMSFLYQAYKLDDLAGIVFGDSNEVRLFQNGGMR